MKTNILRYYIVAIFTIMIGGAFAQDGPGGIGRTATMPLWLDSDVGVTTSGAAVTVWADQSGNGNDINGAAGQEPELEVGALNGHSAIRFNETGSSEGEYMFNTGVNYTARTVVVVFKVGNQQNTGDLAQLWGHYTGGVQLAADIRGGDNDWSVDGGGSATGAISLDGNTYGVSYGNPGTPKWTQDQYHIALLKLTSDVAITEHYIAELISPSGHIFSGDILETVVYDYELDDDVERLRVINYLGSKYNISVGGLTNTTFSNPSYENNLVVIGNNNFNGADEAMDANIGDAGAFYIEKSTGTFSAGERLFVGHNGGASGETTVNDVDSESRWERVWYVKRESAGGGKTVNLSFGSQDYNVGNNDKLGYTINDYRLLYRSGTSGDFSEITVASASLNGD